jgi:O-antigen/teichoic acid export membrane protein
METSHWTAIQAEGYPVEPNPERAHGRTRRIAESFVGTVGMVIVLMLLVIPGSGWEGITAATIASCAMLGVTALSRRMPHATSPKLRVALFLRDAAAMAGIWYLVGIAFGFYGVPS